ncbi:MAG: glutathione S-transferase family protein [Hyphomicrobiaceae bacterium]
MPKLVLYNAPQSTCSQRVRYVLNAKGLAFEEHKLNLLEGDQLKPDYLEINPNGVVPSLVHDGQAVIDSAVIIEYLDEAFPDDAPLRPNGLAEIARMRSMLRFIDEVPAAAIRVPTFNLAFLPRFQRMTEAEFNAFADSKPLRKEFMHAMGRTGFPKRDMDQALDRLGRTLARMDDWIAESGGPWLMGKSITLPDIAVMPVIVRMEDLGLATMWTDRPAIAHWYQLLKLQPPFKPTYYPGSLLTEQFPHLARRG